jgi:hypothetical protein
MHETSGPVHYGYESLYQLLRPKGGLIAGDYVAYPAAARAVESP